MAQKQGSEDRFVAALVPPPMVGTGREALVVGEPAPVKRRPAPFAEVRWRLVPAGPDQGATVGRSHAEP